ncbi:MAG: glutamate-1-semialdehyde 2,1-aminomutase [Candidatus Altiarchaeota archaeon]
MKHEKSRRLVGKAIAVIPGGVNSPVRAWRSVGGGPLYFKEGSGSGITDVDGNYYIDYVMGYGSLILGHGSRDVSQAVQETLDAGVGPGLCTELEVEMANALVSAFRGIEKVRMVNSGTEAVMSSIRLARGFTGKYRIIKFDGCYHGHSDDMLVKVGSALSGQPDCKGVAGAVVSDTLSLPYNDLESVEKILKEHDDVAAVIVEPVAGNMGVIPPEDGFLKGLREVTEENEVLLIFDEVITGFRLCYGGAQDYFGVVPDLTCLGKIIGGGLPVGAYGGRTDIMDLVSPEGGIFQAGTLSGNPVTLAAGLAVIRALKDEKIYAGLRKNSDYLRTGFAECFEYEGVDAKVSGVESMSSVFFTSFPVRDYAGALDSDHDNYSEFFRALLSQGVHIPPSGFESMFLSASHSENDLNQTLDAVRYAVRHLVD